MQVPLPAISVAVQVYPGRVVGTFGASVTVPVATGAPLADVTVTVKGNDWPTSIMPGLLLVIAVVVDATFEVRLVLPEDPRCLASPL
jgi:hypothetical protein